MAVGIFARSGSKGLINKNILPFGETTLLGHTIIQAREALQLMGMPSTEVYVSTDSELYASVALKEGARVPFIRPKTLSKDSSAEILSWKHMLNALQAEGTTPDLYIVLPVTAPLRRVAHIVGAVDLYRREQADLIVGGCVSRKNPYLALFEEYENGYVKLAKVKEPQPARRQDAPTVFENTNSIYVTSPDYIQRATNLFQGKIRIFEVPTSESIDIDTHTDYLTARFLYQETRRMEQPN